MWLYGATANGMSQVLVSSAKMVKDQCSDAVHLIVVLAVSQPLYFYPDIASLEVKYHLLSIPADHLLR